MLPISFDLNHNKLLCPGIHTLFDFTQPKPNEYGDGQDSANKDEHKIYVKRIHTTSMTPHPDLFSPQAHF
jgi:hypothetical protein